MAKKIKRKLRRASVRPVVRGKANSLFLWLVMIIIAFAILLAGASSSLTDLQKPDPAISTGDSGNPTDLTSVRCCDTGNGKDCKPVPGKSIFFRDLGFGSGPGYEKGEYGLIRSNVLSDEDGQHMSFSGAYADAANQKGAIFLNERKDEDTEPPGCSQDEDWYSLRQTDGGWKCYGVENDVIVFVCSDKNLNNECFNDKPAAIWDAYINLGYMALTGGVPGFIANCNVPVVANAPRSSQRKVAGVTDIVFPTKHSLQLETFSVTPAPTSPVTGTPVNNLIKAPFITPFCKPAIYLYPETMMPINVQVASALPLTMTIPQYPPKGWNVLAYPGGDVFFGNQRFDYLYYETEVSDASIRLPEEGFVVDYSSLEDFIPQLVKDLGLNQKESTQFAEYWLGVLPEANYYKVKVVAQEDLDSLARLAIVPSPKTVIRVAVHFEGLDEWEEIEEPVIAPIKREGFTVVEWGGLVKRDPSRPFSCFM